VNQERSFFSVGGVVAQSVFVGALVALWYASTHVWHVPAILLPEPTGVFQRVALLVTNATFLEPLGTTMHEVAVAFAISTVAGIVASYLVTRSAWLVEVFDPLFTSINAVPAILFFPLFALLFGLGPGSKIALGITISFFPIVLNTITAFASVDPVHVRAARSMGASNWHMLRYVLLPTAIPVLLAGLRMGLTLAFLSVLGGETIASFGGLGHEIAESSQAMDSELMYAWILIVICVSTLLNLALTVLERLGARR
jgi:ABC-type nitrate/sulfonate/bicarbonate transport system permease component